MKKIVILLVSVILIIALLLASRIGYRLLTESYTETVSEEEVLETGGIWGMIRELQDGMMEEGQ